MRPGRPVRCNRGKITSAGWNQVVGGRAACTRVMLSQEIENQSSLLMTSHTRHGTPTDSLDILTDTPPIDLFLQAEAMKAGFRLRGTNCETLAESGHVRKLQTELEEIGLDEKITTDLLYHIYYLEFRYCIVTGYGSKASRYARSFAPQLASFPALEILL